MIAPTSFFSDYGGHIRILEEVRALTAQGVEVAVATYYKGNDITGINIHRTAPLPWHTDYEVGSSRHKIAFDAYLTVKSFKVLREFKPDIIHGHMHEGALIGGILSRMARVPLVFDYQGSLTAEMVDHHFLNPHGFVYPWALRVETIITRRLPDAILTSSGQASTLLLEKFRIPQDMIHSLPDCADPVQFDPARFHFPSATHPFRTYFNIQEGATIVGYLGLLTDYQGIPHLIESAVELRARGENVHFLVMGFPNVDHYQGIARLRGVDDIVTFTGRVPFEEAPYFLAACDIAAAPKMSTSEGSGKLLNYMAMALPTVVYDTPVNREYLGDLGVYAQPGDVGAFTNAIVELIHNPEKRRDIGQHLRQRAIKQFSWRRAADEILNLYKNIDKRGKF